MIRPVFYSALVLSWLCAGCEVFYLGSEPLPILPDINQASAQGVVFLLKAELDNNNIDAASYFLADRHEQHLAAIEKYDYQYELARLGRIIANKPITRMASDTLSARIHRIRTEFNYITELTFTTVKLEDRWFIAQIAE